MFDLRGWKHVVIPLVLAGLPGAAIPALQAQTLKGTVLGTITDSSQAVVTGVTVSIT